MFKSIYSFFRHSDKQLRENRWIFGTMLIGAILSLTAAFVLSVESIEIAKNPHAELSCSVNLIVNCATVAAHPTATMFGFPNSFLGMITEPVVITVAVAGLAGIAFPRRFMFVAQIFYTLGFLFALYLLSISMFVIGALCPWCLLVTLTTIMVWFAITRYNLRHDNLYLPKHISRRIHIWLDRDYDKVMMFTLIIVIIAAIILKYGDGLFAA